MLKLVKVMTKKIVIGGGSLSLSKSSIKAMKFVDRALGRAKTACSYASSLSNSHHRHLSAISKKFAARSLKVNRGSAKEKEAKQQLQQQPQKKKALSLLSECFLPVSAKNNDNNYEAVLNGGLLPIAYSARPLPRRFVRGADKTAAVFEAARKKLKLDDDDDDSDRLNRLLCRSVLQRRGGVGRLWGEEESEIRRKQDKITLVVTLLC